MATARSKRGTAPTPEEIYAAAAEFEEPSQDELDLQDFLQDFGPSLSSIDIYRVHKDGRKAYKSRVIFSELKNNAMEYIRAEFGAGKWLLIFRDAGGRIKGNKAIEIEPEGDQPAATIPAPHAAPVDHLQFMREQMMMQQNLLAGLLNRPAAPQMDMGQMMTGLAAIIGAMNGARANGPDLGSIIAALRPSDPSAMLSAVVSAFAALQQGGKKDDDWIEKTNKVLELAKNINPRDDGPTAADSAWGVLEGVGKHVADKFVPLVLPQASGTAKPAPAQLPAEHMQSLPATGANPQKGAEAVAGGEERMMQWIRAGLGYLKDKAKLNKDPQIYVGLIFDNQEEPQWQALLYAIDQGADFDTLLTFDAEIAENPILKQWFRAVYDGLTAIDSADNPAGAPGNTGNISPDAKDGVPGSGQAGDTTVSGEPAKPSTA